MTTSILVHALNSTNSAVINGFNMYFGERGALAPCVPPGSVPDYFFPHFLTFYNKVIEFYD